MDACRVDALASATLPQHVDVQSIIIKYFELTITRFRHTLCINGGGTCKVPFSSLGCTEGVVFCRVCSAKFCTQTAEDSELHPII